MTFVKEEKKNKEQENDDEVIKKLQEEKRKKIEEDAAYRQAQNAKKHKPQNNVQNFPIEEESKKRPIPPMGILNNMLLLIENQSLPLSLEDAKDINIKTLDITPAPLKNIIQVLFESLSEQIKAQGKPFGEKEQQLYSLEFLSCIRELKAFGYIKIADGEQLLVSITTKGMVYLNSIRYLIDSSQVVQQYQVYLSLVHATI